MLPAKTKLPQPAEAWRAIQLEVPPSLWPLVKATAAERQLLIRDYVAEVLRDAVVRHRNQRTKGLAL